MQYNNKKLLIVNLKDRECFDVKNYEWRIIINQLIKLITIIWIIFRFEKMYRIYRIEL